MSGPKHTWVHRALRKHQQNKQKDAGKEHFSRMSGTSRKDRYISAECWVCQEKMAWQGLVRGLVCEAGEGERWSV